MHGDLYRCQIPLACTIFSHRIFLLLPKSDVLFCVKPAAEVTRWHFYLTFLLPHSGNCHDRINISHLSAPLSLNELQRFIYRWPPIQDLLLNNFSQREVIDSQGVLDAPRTLSEHCPNNRVNEAQIGYEYKVISWICWTKITVHLKAHLSVALCFWCASQASGRHSTIIYV